MTPFDILFQDLPGGSFSLKVKYLLNPQSQPSVTFPPPTLHPPHAIESETDAFPLITAPESAFPIFSHHYCGLALKHDIHEGVGVVTIH